MYKFSKVHVLLLACGLLLIFFVGYVEDPHAPDRTINNDFLIGCYEGDNISIVISNGHHLAINGGPKAIVGQLSEIKSDDYVHLIWDKSATEYPLRLDDYADVERTGNDVKSVTLINLPAERLTLKRKNCP